MLSSKRKSFGKCVMISFHLENFRLSSIYATAMLYASYACLFRTRKNGNNQNKSSTKTHDKRWRMRPCMCVRVSFLEHSRYDERVAPNKCVSMFAAYNCDYISSKHRSRNDAFLCIFHPSTPHLQKGTTCNQSLACVDFFFFGIELDSVNVYTETFHRSICFRFLLFFVNIFVSLLNILRSEMFVASQIAFEETRTIHSLCNITACDAIPKFC